MTIRMNLDSDSYDIVIRNGALSSVGDVFDLKRKVLIVTDNGVPSEYVDVVAKQCEKAVVFALNAGENSKNADNFVAILSKMLSESFDRHDCVVAVGGGVVGDVAGFAASCYMRGVDFYNIPTTLLSQVDSSVGGKTAVNLSGVKNAIGTFYQPKGVVIDPKVLSTLPSRQIASGMAEVIKMAVTLDKEFFEWLEEHDTFDDIEYLISKAVEIKKNVVEQDEKEKGLRKVLNFGHTLGHGIEIEKCGVLSHGECVALGMLPMCADKVRDRLLHLLKKNGLPITFDGDKDVVIDAIAHDKKTHKDKVSAVFVDDIGKFEFQDMTITELADRSEYFGGDGK